MELIEDTTGANSNTSTKDQRGNMQENQADTSGQNATVNPSLLQTRVDDIERDGKQQAMQPVGVDK